MPKALSELPFGLAPALPAFDRTTRLAKCLLQADHAVIVLVEHGRIWRSCDPAGTLSSRHTVTEHVMRAGKLMWLENAPTDSGLDPTLFTFGDYRIAFLAATPVRLADGSTPGALIVVGRHPRPFDQTLAARLADLAANVADECDRARAMEAVKRSDERLHLALELADIEVADIDLKRRTVDRAGATDLIFGKALSFETLISGGLDLIDPRDRDNVALSWKRLLEENEPFRPEYRSMIGDGQVRWHRGAVRVFKNEQGELTRYVSAAQNITHRKEAELVLLQAKEEAEAANLAKSNFLATMSHEIRTPLNGVLGMAQAMAMDELTPVQRERLEVIRNSGEALLVILNDVLDFSKIEAGKLELENTEFDIEELARGVYDIFSPAADAKDCRFSLSIAPFAAGVYRGDPNRVRQILCNLVSNALKFTEAGEASLSIDVSTQGWLELRISDSGIGMSEAQLASLFNKFHQGDTSTTRRFGGTGLGLAICRELATLMGGRIGAESRLGEGSTFTVTLPLPRLRDPHAAASAESTTRPTAATETCLEASAPTLQVLAAEDNRVNQLVLKALLRHMGVAPTFVENGRDAIEAWEGQPWDLILMDVQMPRMDGPDATRIIRQRELATGRRRTPIIALTANAMSHQVEAYLAAGMDGFIAKPIEIKRLFVAVDAVLNPEPAEPAGTGAKPQIKRL